MKKIIAIDDQKNWRDLLSDALESKGYQVFTAENTEEGKKIIKNNDFDLAIIDMRLIDNDTGNLEGMRFLKEIKTLYPKMKAVILTGYSDENQKNKAIGYYKADGYFEKVPNGQPMNIEHFTDAISVLLN